MVQKLKNAFQPTNNHTKYWISVVSKNHIKRGVENGFIMVCHGKKGPLQQMKKGDWIVNYSPTLSLEKKEKCQKFTAVGQVITGQIYQVDMGNGFNPFRMNVTWNTFNEKSIYPLIQSLSFITDPNRWGYRFRLGHFEISEYDFQLITKIVNP